MTQGPMTARAYYAALPLLLLLCVAYAIWTQPFLGPDSLTSATARAAILAVWFGVFAAVLHYRAQYWSWLQLLVGFVVGGAWLPMVLVEESATEALPVIAMGVTYGTVSGLYAAVARTLVLAIATGIVAFIAQFLIDFAAAAVGMSRIDWGM